MYVCEDLLLSKVLGFSTQKELAALVDCMKKVTPDTNKTAVKACVAALRNRDDPSEKDLLAQLKDKYCPMEIYDNPQARDECLEQLLLNNMVDVDISKNCQAQVDADDALTTADQKDAALNRCKRMAVYQHLLDKEEFEISDCWDNNKYPTMKDRKKCRDRAVAANRKIRRCERYTDPQMLKSCLDRIKDQDFLDRYMVTKAKKNGIDISMCKKTSPHFSSCLQNRVLNENGELFATDSNNCFLSGDPKACEGKDKALSAVGSSGVVNVNMNKSNSVNNSNNIVDNVAGSVLGGAGAGGIITATNSSGGGGKGGGAEMTMGGLGTPKGDNNWKMMKSYRYIKLRKHSNPICSLIGKAALLRVVGTVGGVVTTGIIHYKVMQDYEKEQKKKDANMQLSAMDHIKKGWKAVAAGAAVKLAFNSLAKNKYLEAQTKEMANLSYGNEPTVCRTTDIKTVSIEEETDGKYVYLRDEEDVLGNMSKTDFFYNEMALEMDDADLLVQSEYAEETRQGIALAMMSLLNPISSAHAIAINDDMMGSLNMLSGLGGIGSALTDVSPKELMDNSNVVNQVNEKSLDGNEEELVEENSEKDNIQPDANDLEAGTVTALDASTDEVANTKDSIQSARSISSNALSNVQTILSLSQEFSNSIGADEPEEEEPEEEPVPEDQRTEEEREEDNG
jgi:hypothetical protein